MTPHDKSDFFDHLAHLQNKAKSAPITCIALRYTGNGDEPKPFFAMVKSTRLLTYGVTDLQQVHKFVLHGEAIDKNYKEIGVITNFEHDVVTCSRKKAHQKKVEWYANLSETGIGKAPSSDEKIRHELIALRYRQFMEQSGLASDERDTYAQILDHNQPQIPDHNQPKKKGFFQKLLSF